jgi:hypothetical protein
VVDIDTSEGITELHVFLLGTLENVRSFLEQSFERFFIRIVVVLYADNLVCVPLILFEFF